MWNTKEMSQMDTALTGVLLTLNFHLEFSRWNCIFGMGCLIVMEQKGWELIGCLDMKHNYYVTSRQRDTVRDWGDLKMSAFPSTCLVYNMEIPYLGKMVFILRQGPDSLMTAYFSAIVFTCCPVLGILLLTYRWVSARKTSSFLH